MIGILLLRLASSISCKKARRALRRIKPFVPLYTLVTLYNLTLITVRPYGIYLWKATETYIVRIQNRAGRVITGLSYDIRSVDVLFNLKWRNLVTRRSHMHVKATLMYKNLIDHLRAPLPNSTIVTSTIILGILKLI